MQALAIAAEWFIGLFQQGGEVFASLVVGIVPLLIVLMTAVNALIQLIGPERIDRVGEIASGEKIWHYPIRYIVLPFLATFFLTNPMAYTMGRFYPSGSSRPSTTPPSRTCTRRWASSHTSTRERSSCGQASPLASRNWDSAWVTSLSGTRWLAWW